MVFLLDYLASFTYLLITFYNYLVTFSQTGKNDNTVALCLSNLYRLPMSFISFHEPYKLVAVSSLLNAANRHCDSIVSIGLVSFCSDIHYHAWKQLTTGVEHGEAYIVGVRQDIALHVSNEIVAVESFAAECFCCYSHSLVSSCYGIKGCYLFFWDGHLDFDLGNVQDGANGLRGECSHAAFHLFVTNDTAAWSCQATVFQGFVCNVEAGLRLTNFRLDVYPIDVGDGL